jgi:uncharacterized delta-60 repeat protein
MRRVCAWSKAGLVVGLAGLVAVVVVVAAWGAAGAFDTSFGGQGYQTVGFGGMDRATHVAVTPDGRIVMVGTTNAGGSNDWAVTRLKADGSDDLTFSGDGQTILPTTAGADDIGAGVVVTADERIVVSGQGNGSKDFVTKRLNVDGSVDASFAGGTGASTVNFGGADLENQMIAQPDGKLVLVGGTDNAGGNFAIARLNPDGTPDRTFAISGDRTVDFGGVDEAVAVANAPGAKLVVVGRGGAGADMVIARLNSDGSYDASFGSGGKASVDFGGTDVANGVVVRADGSIVVAGSTSAVGSGDFAVAKLTASGTLDGSFSGDGKATFGFGAANELALALAGQQNGKLVVMGTGNPDQDFIVVRLQPDGSADTGFGTAGTMTVDFGKYEYDGDVAIQPDGRILVAGSTNVQDDGDMAIARLEGDPVTAPPTTSTPTTPSATTPTTPPSSSPVLPTGSTLSADLVTSTSRTLPGATWLSAGGSTLASGAKLQNVHWTIKGPGGLVLDTDCGSSPALSTPLKKPGNYNVTVVLRDRLGNTSTAQSVVPVKPIKHTYKPPPVHGDGIFLCENPAQGKQPNRADCVKTFQMGLLDVNSRSSHDACFKVEHEKTSLRAVINGPVAINGLYVPVPQDVSSGYRLDDAGVVSVGIEGKRQISVRVGPFLTQTFSLEKRIVPNKQGIFHLVDIDEAANTPKFLGSLPVRGAFAIDLARHKSYVRVGLGLPFPLTFGAKQAAQGDVKLLSDNINGLHYDGLSLKVPNLWLGPLFVNSLGFSYQKSTNSWGGTAKVTLPGSQIALNASGPPEQPPDFGFGIENGRFHHAGFGVDFAPPTQPDLFPPFNSVLLSHIGAAVGLNPLRLTGTIGINAAHVVEEDGVLFGAFATHEHPYTLPASAGSELAPLAGRTFDRFALAIGGTAKLKVPVLSGEVPLLHAYGLYEYPDYFELGGAFQFEAGILTLDGKVGGFAFPSNRTFNLQGGVSACLKTFTIRLKVGFVKLKKTISPCVNIGAVVSSKGLGFCASVGVPTPVGTIPVIVGAGYRWGRNVSLMIFSCDYTPYVEKSPLARAAQAGGAYAVDVPAGLPTAMFRVQGTGGVPDVTVTDPRGTDALDTTDAVAVDGAEPDTMLVAVRHPAAGRWTFTPNDGSPQVAGVALAKGLPPVALKAHVTGKGRRRVLRYTMHAAEGRSVTFLERGPATSRVIGTAQNSAGSIRFIPGPGRAGARRIVAVVTQADAPAREQQIASYVAPRPAAPPRPGRVHARRGHGRIRIGWGRAREAARYEVLVRLADRSQVFRVVRGLHVTVDDPIAAKGGTVRVNALSADGRRSAARAARLVAKRRRR